MRLFSSNKKYLKFVEKFYQKYLVPIKNKNFLTENKIGLLLNKYGISYDRQYKVGKYRLDYYLPDFNIALEFDGPKHYLNPKVVITDLNKDKYLSSIGIKVIRIPYFVQRIVIDDSIVLENEYPHGFIENGCVLPSEYCNLGLRRFIRDINNFSDIKSHIRYSLDCLINEFGNIELIVPEEVYNGILKSE